MYKTILRSALVGAIALSAMAQANAADVTLRFGHFFPPVAGQHKNIFVPWAEAVKKESGGRIDVQMFPSSTLAKPPAQYEAVKNRIMDVTATVLGYTANRFPLTQVVELPGISKNATQGTCIVQNLYDEGLLDSEFNDVKPIMLFTHGPGLLHTNGKTIKEPADLAGLRIRRPTTVVAGLLEKFGAQPVGMPAPASYQSMQRGVIDGVALPWEGAFVFRLNELTKTHTEMGGLYTLSFIVAMNKDVYNDLPADLKKVIDNNTGMTWSKKASDVFEVLDVKGRQQAVDAGQEIITIEGGIENPAWKGPLTEATQSYLDDLEAKGLPAKKVYKRALELASSNCM